MVSWVSALIGLAGPELSDESDLGDQSPPWSGVHLNPWYDDKDRQVKYGKPEI